MAKAIQYILYKNYYLLIVSISNFNLLIKILIKNKIFEFKIKHNIK